MAFSSEVQFTIDRPPNHADLLQDSASATKFSNRQVAVILPNLDLAIRPETYR